MLESSVATTTYRNRADNILFMVKEIPGLNLLGRGAIKVISITVDKFFFLRALASLSADSNWDLQNDCLKLCNDFETLFKPDLGYLRDVELEIKFKSESKPIFIKSNIVPLSYKMI